MKNLPNIRSVWESGLAIADAKSSCRVTIEPDWELSLSGSTVGTSNRGPFRWFQRGDNSQVEVELPNLKTVEIDRSVEQDVASCTISMNNHYMPPGTEVPELAGQYGQPGYFWFGRGVSLASQSRWNHSAAIGGFLKTTGSIRASSHTIPFAFRVPQTNVSVEVVSLDGFADSITFSGPHTLALGASVNLGSFAAGTSLKGFVVNPNSVGSGQCQLRITSSEGYNFLMTFAIWASVGAAFNDTFSWRNVIVGNSLLRTYQGYGAYDENGQPLSIAAGLANGTLTQTGVWLVDTVSGGTNGLINLKCRDIGALLLEQNVMPPLIPGDVYPLEYYPPGKSAYDSPWGPMAPFGSRVNIGSVPIFFSTSSAILRGMTDASDNILDHDFDTYTLGGPRISPAVDDGPDADYATEFWEFTVDGSVDKIQLTPVLGNYICYVSVKEGGTWQGTGTVPYDATHDTTNIGANIPYVMNIGIPWDHAILFQLPRKYAAEAIRLSFRHLVSFEDAPTLVSSFYGVSDTVNHFAGLKDVRCFDIQPHITGSATTGTGGLYSYALARHPTRGYWISDSGGTVTAYGDAAVLAANAPVNAFTNQAMAIVSHPDGKGYWILDQGGRIHAYGSATHFGDAYPFVGTMDMAVTHTGNGYWIIGQNGQVMNFGDAPAYADVPKTAGITFMEGAGLFDPNTRVATCCVAHPTQYGLWIANGNGEVAARGASTYYGGMVDRVFHPGYSDSFVFTPTEWCHAIECTEDGDGYWVAGASGHIAQFGAAVDMGPVYIYADGYNTDVPPIPGDWSFFRALVWDMVRSQDGKGFYILVGDGAVGYFDAQFFSQPGWAGLDGRWHDGSASDYSDIVKELLLWAGWWLYEASPSGSAPPAVWGSIESTGIFSENIIPVEQFDKKTIMDAIKVIREVVGYLLWIDDDGSCIFTSPNFWKSGNFLPDGSHTDTLLELDEETTLSDYTATHDVTQLVSEILIGSSEPDWDNGGSTTSSARYVPDTSAQLRGIVKPAIWTNESYANSDEQMLMAELIALHLWFSQRTGSVTCIANPEIQINDQVKIYERNTSETYSHYVRGVKSSWDADSGRYTMNITTNWLGTSDNWVITKDNVLDPFSQIQVSRRVSEWQSRLGLGLE